MTKRLSILGSTGSIGQSTLALCREYPQYFQVMALSAGENIKALFSQILEFKPQVVSVKTEAFAQELKMLGVPSHTKIMWGDEGAKTVGSYPESDVVVSAIVGAQGLMPTYHALLAGKTVALANKESMIIAGEVLSKVAQKTQAKIIPIDSEHSAIFQCLNGEDLDGVHKLILTASGGPFLNTPVEQFQNITKAQALKHPNWSMGSKITIDSATLMNKGLEVIEAQFLFGFSVDRIDVVVHPQSLVHSLVEFIDGSVLSQMGEPDMRVPIAYALSYPKRVSLKEKKLNLVQHESLTFYKPDLVKFPCLKLAYQVAKQGQSYIAVLNAANEIAVENFLNDQISFVDIPYVIESVLSKHQGFVLNDLSAVLEADRIGRHLACEVIQNQL